MGYLEGFSAPLCSYRPASYGYTRTIDGMALSGAWLAPKDEWSKSSNGDDINRAFFVRSTAIKVGAAAKVIGSHYRFRSRECHRHIDPRKPWQKQPSTAGVSNT
jgi:hypothetical protein